MTVAAHQVELMLLGWNESHNGGFKVTFQVSPEDEDYFKSATVRKGKVAGQRYAGYLIELGADDQPVHPKDQVNRPETAAPSTDPPARATSHKFPGGLCGLAVRWCGTC